MMDLKTAALAAYKEQQEVDAERFAERAQSAERAAAARFRSIFETEPDSVETTQDGQTMVYAGGLSFEWYDRCLHLYDKCPRCGQDCRGQTIGNPYMLGEALATGFIPNYTHNCQPEPEPAPDPMLAALQSIAAELKRRNDYNGEPVVVRFQPMGEDVIPEPADVDPFMPPDGFWQWMPEVQCVAVDSGSALFWYDADIEAGTVAWSTSGISLMDANFGCLGYRDLGDTDWRTTKRTRPSHL